MRNMARPALRPVVISAVAVAVTVALAGSGCGSGGDNAATTTAKAPSTSSARRTVTTSPGASTGGATGASGAKVEGGCSALQEVARLQTTMNAAVGAGVNDLATVQQVLGDAKPKIKGIYSRAATALPNLEAQINTVADLTAEAIDTMLSAQTLDAGKQAVQALPGVADAQAATLEIDSWSKQNCGFAFAN